MIDVSSTTEIFENEEAAKLLDYFVAYKKLMNTIEQIKCIAAVNSEIHFNEKQTIGTNELNQIKNNSLTQELTQAINK
jgi:hypothetical protein